MSKAALESENHHVPSAGHLLVAGGRSSTRVGRSGGLSALRVV